ncbi:hypothetical protein [Methanobrevibacter sp.]|uniref:hypothetical protein n=1 Tax=Methanobrevibacter sp. TaxID=66852 RepID=UPI0039763A80
MKINYKIFGLVMFVMLVCCVSAASAADADNITVPDDTDVIEIDGAVDSVEVVEVDESVDSFSDANQNDDSSDNVGHKVKVVTINDGDCSRYFDTNGYLNDTSITGLTFDGNFNAKSFGNFKINRTIDLNVAGATFNGVSFDLLSDGLILDGATFINNARPANNAYVYVNANNAIVQNLNVNLVAGANVDYFAISVENANNVQILNNVITYTCNYANSANYNYVIRVEGGDKVEVSGNNITAYLPLKDVDFSQPYPSIYTDLVAGVAIQSSSNFVFTNNKLNVTVSRNSTGFPTLDAFIIVDCEDAYIAGNTIIEIDNETRPGNNNYLYAIDVYQCYGITIDNNTIRLESQGGSIIPGTINGTGAAYGIQLTGGHTGVTISNNNINTSNNGPNCGIYSQNFIDRTELNIIGNTIYVEGNASSSHFWSLVTGMELGDDYAYVEGNTITVLNKAVFNTGDNVYGISYSQWCPRDHTYEIYDNTINVINGDYAVYLLNAIDSRVEENCLDTTNYCCDNAVVIGSGSNNNVSDNYCTQCPNCPNCPGCP